MTTVTKCYEDNYRRNKMTVYENLKRKEEILSEASRRAESQDMMVMWFEKSKELQKKINEMTIEEAEREVLQRGNTKKGNK